MAFEIDHYRAYRKHMAEAADHNADAEKVQAKIDRLKAEHDRITGQAFHARQTALKHGRALAALTDRDIRCDRDVDSAVEAYKREHPHIVEEDH